jgi:hypothetical protein
MCGDIFQLFGIFIENGAIISFRHSRFYIEMEAKAAELCSRMWKWEKFNS